MNAPWDSSFFAAIARTLRRLISSLTQRAAPGHLLAASAGDVPHSEAAGPEPTRSANAASDGGGNAAVRQVFADHEIPPDQPTVTEKVKTLLVGKPLDLADKRVYHHISLVAFLAWVGLGADGLSSSCYGPSEAFEHLQSIITWRSFSLWRRCSPSWVISACYSHIIEAFPSGGGGYLVASKMLGRQSASCPAAA